MKVQHTKNLPLASQSRVQYPRKFISSISGRENNLYKYEAPSTIFNVERRRFSKISYQEHVLFLTETRITFTVQQQQLDARIDSTLSVLRDKNGQK